VGGPDMRVAAPPQEYVAAELSADGQTLARTHLFLADLRTLRFPTARLGADLRERDGAKARVAVTTDVFARTVRLGLYGARCDDNYFHLLPGETREIAIDLGRAEGRTLDVSALNAREPLTLEL
jgi:hypothetical protein